MFSRNQKIYLLWRYDGFSMALNDTSYSQYWTNIVCKYVNNDKYYFEILVFQNTLYDINYGIVTITYLCLLQAGRETSQYSSLIERTVGI